MGRHIMDMGQAIIILTALFVFVLAVASLASWLGAPDIASKALGWAGTAFTAILVLLRPNGGRNNSDK